MQAKISPRLTLERLKEVLRYDCETGKLWWISQPRGRRVVLNQEAGSVCSNGYRYLAVDGERFLAHRLAWFFCYGVWPSKNIDHINRQTADNRISNLREANDSQNAVNCGIRPSNTSGYTGVTWVKSKKKWLAYTTKNYRRIQIGYFDTKEAAYEARCAVVKSIHGEFVPMDVSAIQVALTPAWAINAHLSFGG